MHPDSAQLYSWSHVHIELFVYYTCMRMLRLAPLQEVLGSSNRIHALRGAPSCPIPRKTHLVLPDGTFVTYPYLTQSNVGAVHMLGSMNMLLV